MAHELLLVFLENTTLEEEIEHSVNQLIRAHSNLDAPDKQGSRCDGWAIGGRYDGVIHGEAMEYNLTPKEFQSRYGLNFEQIELLPNVRPVSQIERTFHSEINALLFTDNVWVSCFDPQFKDPNFENPTAGPKWKTFLANALLKNHDHLAVVVDVHH